MKLLILTATTFEIQDTIDKALPADVLVGGVGIPSTIYKLTQQLNKTHYDVVVQAGIAGAFTDIYTLGETVLVKQDTFGDLGVEEKGSLLSIFDMGLANKDETPFLNGWLVNDNSILETSHLKTVSAVTVNKITESAAQNELLYKKYNAAIESMEGAALHYVCLQQQLPFIQLRSISNYIGERDKTKWKMKEAIANLNMELEKLINHFINH
jgi:futalosine hydrolase